MASGLPKRPSSIPTTRTVPRLSALWGPLATVATLAVVEILDVAGVIIPNPAPLYFIPIVFATLSGGFVAGAVSAGITMLYAGLFYSEPGELFSYSDDNLRRLAVVLLATPSVVVMIAWWTHRQKHHSETKIIGLKSQLSERGRTEVALGHLAAIVEFAEDAIYSKDLAGRILTWNPAAERLYGFTAKEMSGQPVLKIIPPERHEEMTNVLNTIMAGGRVDHQVTQRMRKDGARVKISLSVSPIRNAAGNIVAASTIARKVP